MKKIILTELSKKELEHRCVAWGVSTYRAHQLFSWIYKKQVFDFDKMSNLPGPFIKKLQAGADVLNIQSLDQVRSRKDRSVKFLFRLNDQELVEGVFMSDHFGTTVCLSTQVGCPLKCRFCASGLVKLKRNLTVSEILGQLLIMQLAMKRRVERVVFMGMGEPLLNFDHLMRAIENMKDLCGIGARKITISTAGVVPGIRKFAKLRGQVRLSISLHALNDRTRSHLMPINKKYALDQLFQSLQDYRIISGRKVTFEYVLLNGVNDKDLDARELARWVRELGHSVNVIEYNEVEGTGLSCSSHSKIFMRILKDERITATLRRSKGQDINAACGQLRASKIVQKVPSS